MMTVFGRAFVMAGLVAAVASCGGKGPGTVIPKETGKGGDGATCDPEKYPCGPYGFQTGSIIENLALVGRPDANKNGNFDDDPVATVELSHYFQDKNIKVLLMTGSAEWCGPCRDEQPGIKAMYEQYAANGGEVAVLESVVQDKQGNPSDVTVADRWRHDFDLPFVVAADPNGALQPYYDINAFPMNMIVRTSDMKIMWQANGDQPDVVAQQIKAVLAHPNP